MIDYVDGRVAHTWITEFDGRFRESQDYLTDLDRLAGDGDFGDNIASALDRTHAALPTIDEATYGSVFTAASRGFMATGGTSGPLFGMWFREISKVGNAAAATVDDLADCIARGLAIVQKLGGASVGDSTMIDALEPASHSLSEAAQLGRTLRDVLEDAARAARAGAESTTALVARKGRASYVGALSGGVLDPGAVTIALFFEARVHAAGAEDD